MSHAALAHKVRRIAGEVLDEELEKRALRRRIEELEEQVRQLRGTLRPATRFIPDWRLHPAEMRLLALLYDRGTVTWAQAEHAVMREEKSEEDYDDIKNLAKTTLCHLRAKLKPLGIIIGKTWNVGPYLDTENKAKVKAGIVSAGDNVAN